jgi:phosphatidate cytidylyltransferase
LFVALAVPQVATFINILLRVYLFADVGIELTNRIAPFFLVELFCFPVIMGALSLVLVLDKKKPNTKFNKIALPLIVAGISFTLSCLLYVAIVRTFSTVLIIVLISIFSDSGAYFIGVFFGKHKMSKYISPKKT